MIDRMGFKPFFLAFILAVIAGCQRNMGDRGRIRPMEQDTFFTDGSSARNRIEGTVSRNEIRTDQPFFTGRDKRGEYLPGSAIAVDEKVMAEGRSKYDVYCSVCHGNDGTGDGIVVKKGFTRPLSFLNKKLISARPGYYFYVMTSGYGSMDNFRDMLDEYERWSIAAYIKNTISNDQSQISKKTTIAKIQ